MVRLLSFGYRWGVPRADVVIDCRGLRNPHTVLQFRDLVPGIKAE